MKSKSLFCDLWLCFKNGTFYYVFVQTMVAILNKTTTSLQKEHLVTNRWSLILETFISRHQKHFSIQLTNHVTYFHIKNGGHLESSHNKPLKLTLMSWTCSLTLKTYILISKSLFYVAYFRRYTTWNWNLQELGALWLNFIFHYVATRYESDTLPSTNL